MPILKPQPFLTKLKSTLENNGIDYETIITKMGQVKASEDRDNGKKFGFDEHLRGLILSMLSSHRLWEPIAENKKEIEEIFFLYDIEKVRNADYTYFVNKLCAIKCGNQMIEKQMKSLRYNIDILKEIESTYGTLDKFITSDSPASIAFKLGKVGKYKLNQIGIPLALEYLRNLGIKAIKPDIHVRRVISNERLGFINKYPTECEACGVLEKIAKNIPCNPTYLDNVLWLFCAQDYGNICNAKPKCKRCELSDYCNYPLLHGNSN